LRNTTAALCTDFSYCLNVWLSLGVTVSSLDETTYQVFAPSQLAMDEAKEMIDDLLSEEVNIS